MTTTNNHPKPTAIISVGYYVASPVQTCDRCGQGIKHVFPVRLKDGTFYKYGSECITRVLEGDTSLLALWKKNAKRLQELKAHAEILARPLDQIPTGHEYYGSGIYIITDEKGKTINGSKTGCCIFHPNVDMERNLKSSYPIDGRPGEWIENGKRCFGSYTPEVARRSMLEKIEEAKTYIAGEIARIEPFLARILAKGLVKAEAIQTTTTTA